MPSSLKNPSCARPFLGIATEKLLPSFLSKHVMHRGFRGSNGDLEHFFVLTAPSDIAFHEQIGYIAKNYAHALQSLGLLSETAVFRRIFLSDVFNQAEMVRRSPLAHEPDHSPVGISIIQQRPLPFAKTAMFAYHIESQKPWTKCRVAPCHVLVEKNHLKHLWSTRLCSHDMDKTFSPASQMRSAFDNLSTVLAAEGGNLRDHCVRTWIYVKDIDSNYQSAVDSRRVLFSQHGMTEKTHYIASTGIEGFNAHRHDLIVMDAYSLLNLQPGQISHLNDYEWLCATKDYNVTFERGTRIAYADRTHYFISGTASIDQQGMVLYPGQVLKQLDRTLQNMEALLKAGQASLADMMYFIVYLRDPADFNEVKKEWSKRLPSVPTVFVQGAVCRPEWLIEIEGFAIAANHQPSLPQF